MLIINNKKDDCEGRKVPEGGRFLTVEQEALVVDYAKAASKGAMRINAAIVTIILLIIAVAVWVQIEHGITLELTEELFKTIGKAFTALTTVGFIGVLAAALITFFLRHKTRPPEDTTPK